MREYKLKPIIVLLAFGLIWGCKSKNEENAFVEESTTYIEVLGVAQDAGYPQMGCTKACCNAFWNGKADKQYVVSLALISKPVQKYWLFEATPDLREQLQLMQNSFTDSASQSFKLPAGIFLTHAHIGHYTGLMQLGKEVMNSKQLSVYAMPKMDSFLRLNAPWSQLVTSGNIALETIHHADKQRLESGNVIVPLLVPHRDEFSETVGYIIEGSKKKLVFIPDINKWEQWQIPIDSLIKTVDYALLDATFYKNGEIPGRNMSEIPHPFVEETMAALATLDASQKSKVYFIHFNHTNPIMQANSSASKAVEGAGFKIARQGLRLEL